MPGTDREIISADFQYDSTVVVASTGESLNSGDGFHDEDEPDSLKVIDVDRAELLSSTLSDAKLGTVMGLDSSVTGSFHGHPKLVCLRTGAVLQSWPSIESGNQRSSILLNDYQIPVLAADRARRRFAVASSTHLNVVKVPTTQAI